MYKYVKILFLGQGTKKNDKNAFEYFTALLNEGYQKAIDFLNAFQ